MALKNKVSINCITGVITETQEEFTETPYIAETPRNINNEIDNITTKLKAKGIM